VHLVFLALCPDQAPAFGFPGSTAFPPRPPAALPGFRSAASLVLCRCTTPRCRSSGTYSSSPSPNGPCPTDHGRPRGLSVLAREVSMHAWGLRLRRACGALALAHAPVWPSGCRDTVGALIVRFRSSQLRDTQPAHAPVQASLRPCSVTLLVVTFQRFQGGLTTARAWLGVRMVRYSFPV
jgi:hypothetical protein